MPDYTYICISPKGEYLRGEYTAADKDSLVHTLWEHQLFLSWWDDISAARAGQPALTEINPLPIPRSEAVRILMDGGVVPSRPIPEHASGEPLLARTSSAPARTIPNRKFVLFWSIAMLAIVVVLVPVLRSMSIHRTWRSQYRQAKQDMERIFLVAQEDQVMSGTYAPWVMAGVLPPRYEKALVRWPVPPCEGWTYSWDNWIEVPGADRTVRVTLRNQRQLSVYYVCVASTGTCAPAMMSGADGLPIYKAPKHFLTCKERF